MQSVRDFKDGELNGESVYFRENGTVSTRTNYSRGLEHGLSILYSEDGTILMQHNYVYGNKQ